MKKMDVLHWTPPYVCHMALITFLYAYRMLLYDISEEILSRPILFSSLLPSFKTRLSEMGGLR